MIAKKIAIVGGCGHVGLPLGLAFADANMSVTLIDLNEEVVSMVNRGILPFAEEYDSATVLKTVVEKKSLIASTDVDLVKSQDVVVFVTGTPVDEHLNPRVQDITDIIKSYSPFLNSSQLIILRSTIYPGTTDIVNNLLSKALGDCKLAFCPERIAQGYGLSEIKKLPQIVSAESKKAEQEASELFSLLAPKIIILHPMEAEIAKLMTNSWRYLEFAMANQFYMMVERSGLDFYKIYDAIRDDYPRAAHFKTPGFAAGPCLFKDTMQLSAFHESNFFLGHAAMLINEGLPVFLVEQLEKKVGCLKDKKIAILGMAFKANNDDFRESLSFKLKRVLEMKMAEVIVSDVYHKEMVSYDQAIDQADCVVLGAPHREYLNIDLRGKPFVDCWGVWKNRGEK